MDQASERLVHYASSIYNSWDVLLKAPYTTIKT